MSDAPVIQYVASRDGSIAGSAASTGGITPPNTGDGGLLHERMLRGMTGALLIAVVTLGGFGYLVRRRA